MLAYYLICPFFIHYEIITDIIFMILIFLPVSSTINHYRLLMYGLYGKLVRLSMPVRMDDNKKLAHFHCMAVLTSCSIPAKTAITPYVLIIDTSHLME
jgi:hypothetical protein